MPKYVLLGAVGAGKSTLFQLLHDRTANEARKTQAMDYDLAGSVDTPGEFFSNPHFYPAMLSATAEAEVLLYVHAADDRECRVPPGFLSIYSHITVACVITKADLPDADVAETESLLRQWGLPEPFFVLGHGMSEKLQILQEWLAQHDACKTCE